MTAQLRAALTDHRAYYLARAEHARSRADVARAFGQDDKADELLLASERFRQHAYGEPLNVAALFLERE